MPKVENTITIGNIMIMVQLALMLVGAGMAWSTVTHAVASVEKVEADHEVRIRQLEQRVLDQLGRIEQRLQSVERGLR